MILRTTANSGKYFSNYIVNYSTANMGFFDHIQLKKSILTRLQQRLTSRNGNGNVATCIQCIYDVQKIK